jgi:hypothetical protein
VDDGLNIRWRETPPDRALVSMALDELAELRDGSSDAMQCEILIERVSHSERTEYHARVGIGGGVGRRARRGHVQADAHSSEPRCALRHAFSQLKALLPASRLAWQ